MGQPDTTSPNILDTPQRLSSISHWYFTFRFFMPVFVLTFIGMFGINLGISMFLTLDITKYDVFSGIQFILTPLFALLVSYIWSNIYRNAYTFTLTENSFNQEWGIIKKREKIIPYDHIQEVRISRNLLMRLFGLARVEIETARSQNTSQNYIPSWPDIVIPALTQKRAQRVQEMIQEKSHKENSTTEREPISAHQRPPRTRRAVWRWIGTVTLLTLKIIFVNILLGIILAFVVVFIESPTELKDSGLPEYLFFILSSLALIVMLVMSLGFLDSPKGKDLTLQFRWVPTKSEAILFIVFALIFIGLFIGATEVLTSMSPNEFREFLLNGVGVPTEPITVLENLVNWPVFWQTGYALLFAILTSVAEALFFHGIFQQGLEQRSSKEMGVVITMVGYFLISASFIYALLRLPSILLYAQRRNLAVTFAFSFLSLLLFEVLLMFTLPI